MATSTGPTSRGSTSRSPRATATTSPARPGASSSTSTSEAIASSLAALERIFLGQVAGTQIDLFPWAWKQSIVLAVRPARIEVDHTPRRQWFRVRDSLSVRIRGPVDDPATVTCVVPGHEQAGEELVAEHMQVDDASLRFEYRGNCGYASGFDYRG